MTILQIIFLISMFVLSCIDIRKRKIPNTILIIDVFMWMAVNIILCSLSFDYVATVDLVSHVASCVILILVFACLDSILSRYERKMSLGGGDIKLIGVMGLYFGFWKCIIAVFAACIVELVIILIKKLLRKSTITFPFCPALFAGTLLMCLLG